MAHELPAADGESSLVRELTSKLEQVIRSLSRCSPRSNLTPTPLSTASRREGSTTGLAGIVAVQRPTGSTSTPSTPPIATSWAQPPSFSFARRWFAFYVVQLFHRRLLPSLAQRTESLDFILILRRQRHRSEVRERRASRAIGGERNAARMGQPGGDGAQKEARYDPTGRVRGAGSRWRR
jgi:hypothetical protein